MNALAVNPTAAWFLHSSAVEEVGPWWMLLVTVGVWAVLDISRSYLPSVIHQPPPIMAHAFYNGPDDPNELNTMG